MDERAETEPRFQDASGDRVVVPADVLESHHPDAELVVYLGAALNAVATVLRLYDGVNGDRQSPTGPRLVRAPTQPSGDRVQLYLLAAFHLKQALDVLASDRLWWLADLGRGERPGPAGWGQWRADLRELKRELAKEVRSYLGLHWVPDALWQWRRQAPANDAVLWQAVAPHTSTSVSPMAEVLLCSALFDGGDPRMVLDDRIASLVEAHRKVVMILRLVTVGFLRDRGLEPSSELPVVDEPVAVES